MKRSYKLAAAAVAATGLAIAAAAFAQPGPMGEGMGSHGMGGMHPGMMGKMGHAGMGPGANMGAVQSLMTPEERTALQEKMRNAKSPEERQKLAESTHAEMQKRAKEKGIALPDHGPAFTH